MRVDEILAWASDAGPLSAIIDGPASDSERAAFIEAWHGQVGAVSTDRGGGKLFEESVLE